MKIAITTTGNDLNAPVDDRFGRSDKYLIIDDQTNEFIVIDNPAKNESSGAGGKAVQLLDENDVKVVLSPHVGPKAMTALEAFEIKAFYFGESKTVQEALDVYRAGSLKEVTKPKPGLRKA